MFLPLFVTLVYYMIYLRMIDSKEFFGTRDELNWYNISIYCEMI